MPSQPPSESLAAAIYHLAAGMGNERTVSIVNALIDCDKLKGGQKKKKTL